MLHFIYAVLITYGISLIIVHGTIFRDPKKYLRQLNIKSNFFSGFRDKILEMINCMLCVSFWIGALVGAYFEILPAWNVFFNGGLLTATTWILHCIMSFLGNGYDPGRVFNLNITEPIKFEPFQIEKAEKKEETINTKEQT